METKECHSCNKNCKDAELFKGKMWNKDGKIEYDFTPIEQCDELDPADKELKNLSYPELIEMRDYFAIGQEKVRNELYRRYLLYKRDSTPESLPK